MGDWRATAGCSDDRRPIFGKILIAAGEPVLSEETRARRASRRLRRYKQQDFLIKSASEYVLAAVSAGRGGTIRRSV
jgi:hypothetical protein